MSDINNISIENQWVTEETTPTPHLTSTPVLDERQAAIAPSEKCDASPNAIKKMWFIFTMDEKSVIELRALWPSGITNKKLPKVQQFRAKDFPSIDTCKDAFEAAALDLNARGYNVYLVMNTIRPDFAEDHAAGDADILYRDLLLIDIDRIGNTSCPANESELNAAKTLAEEIRLYLTDHQWPTPIMVMSGNGYHLYYRLNQISNDANSASLIKRTLNSLAARFDNDVVGIDTVVYNAARITKVPGTIMRKGKETSERPYRMAHVRDGWINSSEVHLPALNEVTQEMLERLNEDLTPKIGAPSHFGLLPGPMKVADKSILNHLTLRRNAEIPEVMARLDSVLAFLPSDVPRGNGAFFSPSGAPENAYWLGVVWAGATFGNDTAKEKLRAWSKKSPRYSDEGFETAWHSYNPNHPNPVGIGSLMKFAKMKGWTEPASPFEARPASLQSYKLLGRADILSLPATPWRVKSIFPETGLGAVYGPSASGKSFLAIDLACAIAAGKTWFGHKTYACPVTYVMLEGEAGLAARVRAWEKGTGTSLPENFFAITQPFRLTDLSNLTGLLDALPKKSVVFLDTLNRAAPTTDENSSAEMGEVLQAAKNLQLAIEGLVVVVHHTGKDVSRGMRGHSSLFAALDGAIEVMRNDDKRSWTVAKSKEAADGAVVPFRLTRHVLGLDADADEIASCTVENASDQVFAPREPTGAKQRLALQATRKALAVSNHLGVAGSGVDTPCIKVDEAKTAIAAVLTTEPPNKRRNRAKALIEGLLSGGFLSAGIDQNGEGWLWKP